MKYDIMCAVLHSEDTQLGVVQMHLPSRRHNPNAADLLVGADYLFNQKMGIDNDSHQLIRKEDITFSSWLLYRVLLFVEREQISTRKVPSEVLFQSGMAVLEGVVFAAKAARLIKRLRKDPVVGTTELEFNPSS